MSLYHQTVGDSADKPFVFIHGLGGTSSRMVSALDSLKNRFIIFPDMPGHGGSQDYSLDQLSFENFADLIIELMDSLGIKSCDLGGLSMGSGITLNLALRYPERVEKMVILRPSWLSEKEPEHLKLVACVGESIEKLGIQQARQKLLSHPAFKQLDTENKPVAESILALFSRPRTPASTAVLYKMWQDSPFVDPAQLSTLSQPTLVLTTTRDELHPQSTADVISAHLPDVRTAELPPRYHQPEQYSRKLCKLLDAFLNE